MTVESEIRKPRLVRVNRHDKLARVEVLTSIVEQLGRGKKEWRIRLTAIGIDRRIAIVVAAGEDVVLVVNNEIGIFLRAEAAGVWRDEKCSECVGRSCPVRECESAYRQCRPVRFDRRHFA